MMTMRAGHAYGAVSAVTRLAALGFAGLAIAWACFCFPIFWRQSPFDQIKRHIIAGDTFKPDVLMPFVAAIGDLSPGKWYRPSVLGAAAIVDLRMLEQAMAGDETTRLDRLMTETDGMIRLSLSNAPADSFLWTVLFWLENAKDGFKRSRFGFLDMSYRLGPNEGWIAIKRNRFAVALYSSLPAGLANDVAGEFSRLVGSNYFGEAFDILSGPGWPVHDVLLTGLATVDNDRREAFSKFAYRKGLDVQVPGVVRPEWRPWH